MTAYDSVERGAADECEPLRGRRPRTFTLTQLLVACGAVCVCSIAATTAVNTPRATSSDAHLGDAHMGVAGVHGKFGIMRVRGEQSELTDGWWTEDRRARHSGAI